MASHLHVQRQISLPLSKAVEIAYKSIRLRLSRSLLVTSGIMLAMAFLLSISANEVIINGMRRWMAAAPQSNRFNDLRLQRDQLEQRTRPAETALRAAVHDAPKGSAQGASFDYKNSFGLTYEDVQTQVGEPPVSQKDLTDALASSEDAAKQFKAWLDVARPLRRVREELSAPQALGALMQAKGVPTQPEEIASQKIQTRWLLGLALLVAFVGILNAMLMSVTERFREIGTMKCLGALDGFIVKLFLIESLFQGVIGTSVGIVVGLALSLLAAASSYGGYAFSNLPYGEIARALLNTFIVGVTLSVGGALYPAIQAARMQPIEAMRTDV